MKSGIGTIILFCAFSICSTSALGNAYREKGKLAKVGDAGVTVVPPRDWNRLDLKPGKFAEIWTLDGEQLNDVTFYNGVTSGQPLLRERNKKREPLPKFQSDTLLIEIPELLEGTYRTSKKIGAFTLTKSTPHKYLGSDGVLFTYEFTDNDGLPRKGEARAAIINKKLYMVTFDAPRLHYYDRTVTDFRALVDAAAIISK